MDRVTSLNPTKLAYIDNTAISRVIINDLRSQPLQESITVHRAYELVCLSGVSFWPYWASLNNVNNYTLNNRKSFWFFRADNPQLSNIFSIYDNNYIIFDYTPDGQGGNGITSRFKGQNIDCDEGVIGIIVAANASGTTAQFSNFETVQSQNWTATAPNILIAPGNVSIDLVNVRLSNAVGNAVGIASSTGTRVSILNGWAENWNRANTGNAAFYVDVGATIILSPIPHVTGGNGAAVYAGAGNKLQGSVSQQ